MKKIDLQSKSIDELWALHEEIAFIVSTKMETEKSKLEERLQRLGHTLDKAPDRRPYPKVHPKFRNPDSPHQTWSGRGKQPLWIRRLLANGKTMEDCRILPDGRMHCSSRINPHTGHQA
jgi:DNA-binding protein H-NS